MMPTLEQFLAEPMKRPWNAWVKHPGWAQMYVRRGPRCIGGKIQGPVLTLANIEVKKPGEGTLTKFLDWFHKNYGWPVVVESVLSPRFAGWLVNNGFQADPSAPGSFWRIAPMHDVICQRWIESERGWGQRPDGYSLHKTNDDRKQYITEYNKTLPDEVPDEYSRPDGEPYIISVDDETYERLCKTEHGFRSYDSWPKKESA